MAKLVIGTNKQTAIPAIVRDMSPAHYVEKTVVNGTLQNGTTIINLDGVTDVGEGTLAYAYNRSIFPANTSIDLSGLTTLSSNYACYSMFDRCQGIISVDLSGLTTISGTSACSSMFSSCTGLISVDLSSLTTISGSSACQSMFNGCTGLTSVDLSGVTTISGYNACSYMFAVCKNLTSVDLSSLTTISGSNACNSMFSSCAGLITVKLNALNTITQQIAPSYGQMFSGCPHLESVEFGGLTASTFASKTDQIAYLFKNDIGSQATNGCTVHFPSNFDPSDPNHTFDASTLTGYPTFNGDANYIHIAFDLPATE